MTQMATPPKRAPAPATPLSVVVCTHGRRPEALRRCLASLTSTARPGVEVLVVDNGPRPTVREVIGPDVPVRVVHEPRRGLDNARNRGVSAAQGDLIAFIDDDCEADPAWFDALRRAFADPAVDCVTGRVVAANPELVTARWFETRFSFDRGGLPDRFERSDRRRWFPVYPFHLGTGCNMAFRRSLLERIGGFDPALDMGTPVGGGGDLDAFARTLDAGAVAYYEPDALVRHHHRSRRGALVRQFVGYGATVSALCLKAALHRPGQRRRAVRFALWYLRDTLGRMLARARGRDPLPLYLYTAELAGQLWGPFGYLLGLARVRLSWRR